MRRKSMAVALAAAFGLSAFTPAVWADASAPTNGGNGAGQSGQCTGNPDDRPASCHDQGGPGNQPGPP
jgi:hypothetical protein